MQVAEALKNLGLNEKEARVYLALLQLGRASAYAVAERAGLKRPTTYVILGELMQKGLALKIPRSRKQLFAAKSPEEFFAEARERLRIAESVLPQLVAMADKPEQKLRTLYYEGIGGLREMYKLMNERMKGREITGFYARIVDEPAGKELEEKVFVPLNEERKRWGVKLRGVSVDEPSMRWYKENAKNFGYQIKFLNPGDYRSEMSIEIGDTFAQISSHRYLQGIHIENPDIAKALSQIFEMVWNCRREPVEGVT